MSSPSVTTPARQIINGTTASADIAEAVAAFVGKGASKAARSARLRAVRRLRNLFGGLDGWLAAPLEQRLASAVQVRGLAVWLALATSTPLDGAYVAASHAGWGHHLSDLAPAMSKRFAQTAARLGFSERETTRQWATLGKLVAVAGCCLDDISSELFDTATAQLAEAIRAERGRLPNTWTTPLHGLRATLTTLGTVDGPGPKRVPDRGRPSHWQDLAERAPELVRTMRRYLAQLALSMRPGSVALIDTTMRHFASYLTDYHENVDAVAEVRRTHIEGFKAWLESRTGYRGRSSPAKTTIGMRVSHLRSFFDRIIEWGYADAPVRNPVFAGDMPIRDRPLPRFLDDPDAAKLMAAARALPDLFGRVCVEVLARTGLRKGEFLGLTLDAIVRIGEAEWLRTPVGKLHNDRYIPLHPRVRTLLTQWIEHRGDQPGELVFVERGRRIPQTRVDKAVQRAATAAGLGHITPHQLRHTLATQAINRGMSLESIAALLGHKSMTMTMTYARIADRTVADEYFAVSKRVESLYAKDETLPAEAAGPNMRRLHTETSRRLLGNGYCTRPAELGCRYETICESCTFFATTIEFREQIQAQHADAERHGDTDRQRDYQTLLDTLDQPPA